jgi:tetratricopeptide (TPR) repeat protein
LPSSGLACFLLALPLLADVAAVRDLIRSGRFTEAVATCDRELKTAPRSVPLHTLKGLALQASGDKPAALLALRQALSIEPKYEPALQAAAQLEFDMLEFAAASRTLESLLAVHPGLETAHAMLASALFEQRACDRALIHFTKAQPTPAMRWQHGVCLMDQEKWLAATAQFEALLTLREHPPTRYNLALAYWNAKRFQEAATTVKTLSDPDSMRLLASAQASLKDIPNALATLQKAIVQYPGNEPLLIDLAVLCLDHSAYDIGVAVVRAGLDRIPGSARLQTLLGVLHVKRGDLEAAQKTFLNSHDATLGSIGSASTLMQLGLANEAAALLREHLRRNGPEPRVELTLARAILLEDSTQASKQEAMQLLRSIAQREPSNANAHALLGKVHFQLDEFGKAAIELETALRLDPKDRASAYQLATVYRKLGRTQEAAAMAAKVKKLLETEKQEEAAVSRFQVVRENRDP